jgi:hypothetical protein
VTRELCHRAIWLTVVCLACLSIPGRVHGQTNSSERTFTESKAEIDQAVRAIQTNLSGRLPVLDGFASAGDHPLEQYRRGYYQATVDVTSVSGAKCVVRVTVKVTAWHSDPQNAHSSYELLMSNGRIESDLLDQLSDQLNTQTASSKNPVRSNSASQPRDASPSIAASPATAKPDVGASSTSAKPSNPQPANATASAPAASNTTATNAAAPPKTLNVQPNNNSSKAEPGSPAADKASAAPTNGNPFSQSMKSSLSADEIASARPVAPPMAKSDSALQSEFESLQEVLKNQAHPKNLVAVRKSGTAVVDSPSLNAKTLFMASLHDEFEMLDFNRDWVHVRISGLSRGWIWRNSVEMPEGIPDTLADPGPATASDLFHVVREETAQFPGDWEPLRGKNVKILSVQKTDENSRDAGPRQRLEYTKFLLDKSYAEITQKPQNLAGIVVIFDSADGGMIAATVAALQEWRAGTLTDSALWHKCFFDPPETFDSAPPSGTH